MPKDPIKTLEAIEKNLEKKVGAILNAAAFKIRARVASQEFIHWKSRRQPIVVERAKPVGTLLLVTVRTSSHWDWGHVLVGPAGSTTIKPKKGMLAIPTDFAHKGVKTPKSYGGDLQIFAGIMWGKAGWGGSGTGGGLRQHRSAGEKFGKSALVPMFILKGSVVVSRKVHPAELQAWGYQLLRQALLDGKLLNPD